MTKISGLFSFTTEKHKRKLLNIKSLKLIIEERIQLDLCRAIEAVDQVDVI